MYLKDLLCLQTAPEQNGDTWPVVLLLKNVKVSEINGVKQTNSASITV